MPKLTVGALLGDQLAQDQATTQVPQSDTSELAKDEVSELPNSYTSEVAKPSPVQEEPPVTPEMRPKYLRLERKDTRLHPGQLDELMRLARRLQKARPQGSGERITENTLIRVGVGLVLSLGDALSGATGEEELTARAHTRLAMPTRGK